jgi:hypothetical protein
VVRVVVATDHDQRLQIQAEIAEASHGSMPLCVSQVVAVYVNVWRDDGALELADLHQLAK